MKKFGFLLVLLITFMFLAGCGKQAAIEAPQEIGKELIVDNKETAKTVPEKPKYTFELKSAEVKLRPDERNERFIAALEFTYVTNITKEDTFGSGMRVDLIVPSGKVRTDFIDPTGNSFIDTSYQEKGDYKLIVYDPGKPDAEGNDIPLFEKTFTYKGPEVTIISATVSSWDPNHALGWEPDALLVTVKNTGDLPFRATYKTVVDRTENEAKGYTSIFISDDLALGEPYYVDPEELGQYNTPGWILPNSEKTYPVRLQWMLSTGTHEMEILLRNFDQTLQTFPFTLTTPNA